MRLARAISVLMTALGLAIVLVGVLAEIDPTVRVAGMMLVVAGVIKIIMVAIWQWSLQAGAKAAAATRPDDARPA